MRTSIVQIGNSKGIRIPKAILEQCHIEKEVQLEIENNAIIIKPYKRKPRKEWEKYFKKMRANNDDKLIIDDNIDIEMENWDW